MVPPNFVLSPTASQLTGLAHETAESEPTLSGAESRVQLEPASVVVTMLVAPTAVHVVVLMQLMPERVVAAAGAPKSDQWEPPFVVPTTWAPAATHVVSVGHAMALSALAYPVGTDCGVQD
jgi:hypothetical protein